MVRVWEALGRTLQSGLPTALPSKNFGHRVDIGYTATRPRCTAEPGFPAAVDALVLYCHSFSLSLVVASNNLLAQVTPCFPAATYTIRARGYLDLRFPIWPYEEACKSMTFTETEKWTGMGA